MRKFSALAFVSLVLLSGCYRAVGVEAVEHPDGRISNSASESWRLHRPCVYQVWIYRVIAGRQHEYWSVALPRDETKCVGVFTYPETPPGYDVVIRPRDALHTGDVLDVEISGGGFDNTTRIIKR